MMGANTVEARALFHDRDAMERAVRELVQRGVSAQRIRVSPAHRVHGRIVTPPSHGRAVLIGSLAGALVGIVLAVVWLTGRAFELPSFFIVLRTLTGAWLGALVGGLFAYVFDRAHRSREDLVPGSAYDEFLVDVRSSDSRAVSAALEVLSREGGAPLPT